MLSRLAFANGHVMIISIFSWEMKSNCYFAHLQIINNLLIYQAVVLQSKELFKPFIFHMLCCMSHLRKFIWIWIVFSLNRIYGRVKREKTNCVPNTRSVVDFYVHWIYKYRSNVEVLHCAISRYLWETNPNGQGFDLSCEWASFQINNHIHSSLPVVELNKQWIRTGNFDKADT